jgi:archaemetzincin
MPPKRKLESNFVKNFKLPSEEDVMNSLGEFPWNHDAKRYRNTLLLGRNNICLDDLDDPKCYSVTDFKGKRLWTPLPLPKDDTSWLAKNLETGQTFEDYALYKFMNRRGSVSRNADQSKQTIYFLPIIPEENKQLDNPWNGPDLNHLSQWTSHFYDREVILLPIASITAKSSNMTLNSPSRSWSTQGRLHITDDGHKRFQVDLFSLLNIIKEIRESKYYENINLSDAFCIIGISMCDIYSHNDDLFVAGMASPMTNSGVLSFFRYHPMIKMQANNWSDYAYVNKESNYPYFEEGKKRPSILHSHPSQLQKSITGSVEYLRRAGKLIIHEIGHLYGMEHCIYYNCLMNGTGNLVEDFSGPSHLCPVCLRKMQFRLGFNVSMRYQKLLDFSKSVGMTQEALWNKKVLSTIGDNNLTTRSNIKVDTVDILDRGSGDEEEVVFLGETKVN